MPTATPEEIFEQRKESLRRWRRVLRPMLGLASAVRYLQLQLTMVKAIHRVYPISSLQVPRLTTSDDLEEEKLKEFMFKPEECTHKNLPGIQAIKGPYGNPHGRFKNCQLCGSRWKEYVANGKTTWIPQLPYPSPGAPAPRSSKKKGASEDSASSASLGARAKSRPRAGPKAEESTRSRGSSGSSAPPPPRSSAQEQTSSRRRKSSWESYKIGTNGAPSSVSSDSDAMLSDNDDDLEEVTSVHLTDAEEEDI